MEIITNALLIIILAEVTFLTIANTKSILPKSHDNPIFIDTSVLIDGRIIAVAESGFITGSLAIPRSVVGELQFLADQADTEKRTRARHGLDVIVKLQAIDNLNVSVFQDGSHAEEGVDERLLNLAKKHNGSICTIDYNLNKVAKVEGITVLNVNDLALSLRMAYLPGEKIMLELTQKGQDSNQAIGHLTDGTMVVVENASKYIGKSVEIEFIRSLQTAAGKMMFAKLVNQQQNKPQPYRSSGRKPVRDTRINKTDKAEHKSAKAPIKKTGRQYKRRISKPAKAEQNIVDMINNQ